MVPDKDKAISSILGKMGVGAAPGKDAESPQGDEGLRAAAEELISALHSKDSAGVVEALRSAFSMLETQEEPQPEAETPEAE